MACAIERVFGYIVSTRPHHLVEMKMKFRRASFRSQWRLFLGWSVLLTVIGFVAFILVPALSPSLGDHSGYLRQGRRCRVIFLSIFSKRVEHARQRESAELFPEPDRFENSNQYFLYLIDQGVFEEESSRNGIYGNIFAPYPLKPTRLPIDPSDPESVAQFTAEHNFWSVVEGVSITSPPDNPFIISKNFVEPVIRPSRGPDDRPQISKDELDIDYVLYVNMGGAVRRLSGQQITWENLNPTGVRLRVLHPGPPVRGN